MVYFSCVFFDPVGRHLLAFLSQTSSEGFSVCKHARGYGDRPGCDVTDVALMRKCRLWQAKCFCPAHSSEIMASPIVLSSDGKGVISVRQVLPWCLRFVLRCICWQSSKRILFLCSHSNNNNAAFATLSISTQRAFLLEKKAGDSSICGWHSDGRWIMSSFIYNVTNQIK